MDAATRTRQEIGRAPLVGCGAESPLGRFLFEMAEKVEGAVEPTRVRACLLFAPPFPDEMPESAKQQAIAGAWENAQQETEGLREQLQQLPLDLSEIDVKGVAGQDVDPSEATAAAVSVWQNEVLSEVAESRYREFSYAGNIDFPGAGAHFKTFLNVLVFGKAKS